MAVLEDIFSRLSSNSEELTILNLNHRGIGNRGATLLAKALETNDSLVVLFLDGNDISAAGAKELAASLSRHPRLRQLFMSYNPIGDEGAVSLAHALNGMKLNVLKLADCQVGALGAVAIAGALRHNQTIVRFIMESNPRVGVEGAICLAREIRDNRTLTCLDLQGCVANFHDHSSPGCQVQQAFMQALKVNKTMNELLLEDACLAEQVGASSNAMKNRRTIQHFLFLNRLGRRFFHEITIPNEAWPRLLASASYLDKNQAISAPSLLYAILTGRPDLVTIGERPNGPGERLLG